MDQQEGLSVREALEKLTTHGDARQIADYLHSEKIVGVMRRGDACVVAAYVKQATGQSVKVRTFPSGGVEISPEESENLPLPEVLYRLADGFDKYEYPELVREDES